MNKSISILAIACISFLLSGCSSDTEPDVEGGSKSGYAVLKEHSDFSIGDAVVIKDSKDSRIYYVIDPWYG